VLATHSTGVNLDNGDVVTIGPMAARTALSSPAKRTFSCSLLVTIIGKVSSNEIGSLEYFFSVSIGSCPTSALTTSPRECDSQKNEGDKCSHCVYTEGVSEKSLGRCRRPENINRLAQKTSPIQAKLTENKEPPQLTLNENESTLFENKRITSALDHINEKSLAKAEFLPATVAIMRSQCSPGPRRS
jgi:hypothetical protein